MYCDAVFSRVFRGAQNQFLIFSPFPRRRGGIEAENTLSGWHDPYRDAAAGIQAKVGCGLVRRPRLNLIFIRFHGVLTPNAQTVR